MIKMVRDALVLESIRAKNIKSSELPDVFTGPLGDDLWPIVVDFAYDGGRLMDAILTQNAHQSFLHMFRVKIDARTRPREMLDANHEDEQTQQYNRDNLS